MSPVRPPPSSGGGEEGRLCERSGKENSTGAPAPGLHLLAAEDGMMWYEELTAELLSGPTRCGQGLEPTDPQGRQGQGRGISQQQLIMTVCRAGQGATPKMRQSLREFKSSVKNGGQAVRAGKGPGGPYQPGKEAPAPVLQPAAAESHRKSNSHR